MATDIGLILQPGDDVDMLALARYLALQEGQVAAALLAKGAGLKPYMTEAALRGDTDEAVGSLAYVYANNGSPSDPANRIYQWNGAAWVEATWFTAGLARPVQPLVDRAEAAAASAAANAVTIDGKIAAIPQQIRDTLGVVETGWPRGAHAFWRIRGTASNVSFGAYQLSVLEFRAMPDGTDQSLNGSAFSSAFNPPYGPGNAFDGNTNTEWQPSSQPSHVGYAFASPVSVGQIAIRARGEYSPKDIVVEYSDDNQTWVTAWTITGQTGWAEAGEVRTFTDPKYGQASKRVVLDPPVGGRYVRENGAWVAEQAGGGGGGKSANTQALIAAMARGSFPSMALPEAQRPVVTLLPDGSTTSLTGSTFFRAGLAGVLQPQFSQRFGAPFSFGAPGAFADDWMRAKGAWRGPKDNDRRDWASTHSAFEFMHTGRNLEIVMLAAGGGTGARLLVNGRVVWTGDVPTTSSQRRLRIEFPSAGAREISFETRNQIFLGAQIEVGATLAAVAPRPWVSVQGDSFIDGSGGTMIPNGTPGAIAARCLGMNGNIVGVGSTGMLSSGTGINVPYTHANRIDDLTMKVTGITPAMGIIFGTPNDGASAPGNLQQAITDASGVLIEAWAGQNPGKPLVFFGPWNVNGQAAQPTPLTTYYIRDGIQRAAWQYRSQQVFFIDQLVPDLMVGSAATAGTQSDYYSHTDEVHPSQAGADYRGLSHAGSLQQLICSAFA